MFGGGSGSTAYHAAMITGAGGEIIRGRVARGDAGK
jgi:hypothetical protein